MSPVLPDHASPAMTAALLQVPIGTYRTFDLAVSITSLGTPVQQQALLFHPWQGSLPDAASNATNGTAIILGAGAAGDTYSWAPTQRLLLRNVSSQGGAASDAAQGLRLHPQPQGPRCS